VWISKRTRRTAKLRVLRNHTSFGATASHLKVKRFASTFQTRLFGRRRDDCFVVAKYMLEDIRERIPSMCSRSRPLAKTAISRSLFVGCLYLGLKLSLLADDGPPGSFGPTDPHQITPTGAGQKVLVVYAQANDFRIPAGRLAALNSRFVSAVVRRNIMEQHGNDC
jgi:hypothetical protein